MTVLRQRFIEDMRVRNYSPRTVQAYVAAVVKLARHLKRPPDQASVEEIRRFQVELLAKEPSWSQFNQVVAGLRLFFGTTLNKPGVIEMLPYGKRPKRLPTVLSVEEVSQLLEAGLCALAAKGTLALPDVSSLYAKDWVVYAKPPFGGPEQVLKYLARYTHRVAISNHRLVKLEAGRVTFRMKDYADGGKEKHLTLSAEEFLRRFVQHVLPKGFMKIRHYGLLASRQREARLRLARRLLLTTLVVTTLVVSSSLAPAESPRCPACGSVRLARGELVEPSPFACVSRVAAASKPSVDTS
jgi:putative transposase/integrase-like protein